METRPLYKIAEEIKSDWKNVYFGAVPYLNAMRMMVDPADQFGMDSGRSIILYFLANASAWRGDTARRIKKELKSLT